MPRSTPTDSAWNSQLMTLKIKALMFLAHHCGSTVLAPSNSTSAGTPLVKTEQQGRGRQEASSGKQPADASSGQQPVGAPGCPDEDRAVSPQPTEASSAWTDEEEHQRFESLSVEERLVEVKALGCTRMPGSLWESFLRRLHLWRMRCASVDSRRAASRSALSTFALQSS